MKRFISILLLTLIFLSVLPIHSAFAAAEHEEYQRIIAVVFDNSGSMYRGGGSPIDSWCRATYALEVFASMMNRGDKLIVYPMNEFQINGRQYSMQSPLIITDPNDASQIREIYTEREDGGTPIQTIDFAIDGLNRENVDLRQKWLVVLTDGDKFHPREGNDQMSVEQTKEELEITLRDVPANTLYLGIGKKASMPSITNSNSQLTVATDKAGSSDEILSKLTKMCNTVFGRDALDSVGSSVSFDVSMNKLFIFAQGKDISNLKLTDGSGAEIGGRSSELQTRYSDKGAGASGIGLVDTNLQGVIVTYITCPAGSYTLSYNGEAKDVGIYYEPDVDLVAQLIDPNGSVVDKNTPSLIPGEYTLKFGLIDNQTGEMTGAKELGSINYDAVYKLNGQEHPFSSSNKSDEIKIDLNIGDTFEGATITAEYLSGYRITKGNPDFNWPEFGFPTIQPGKGGDLELRISGGQDIYHLSQIKDEAKFEAELWYDGRKLTGSELASASLTVDPANGIKFRVDPQKDRFDIYLDYADPSNPESVVSGDVAAKVYASYTEPDHEPSLAEGAISFNVQNDVTGLGMNVHASLNRMTLGELADNPVYVDLRMGGEKLSDSEMNSLNYDISIADGSKTIPFTVEKDYENSRLVINLDKDGVEKGNYTVNVSAVTKDRVGKDTSATGTERLKVRLLPQWVLWLASLIILALLAALIWYVMSRKILPKRVFIDNTSFNVDGEDIPGDATVSFNDGKKKSGTITINSPRHPTNPLANCRVTLRVDANDTRMKAMLGRKTGRLTAKLTNISTSSGVSSVSIAGVNARWDEDHHPIIRADEADGNPYEAILSSPENMSVNAEVMNEYGGSASVAMSCTLRFQ